MTTQIIGKRELNDATIPQNAIQVKDIHFPKGAVKSFTPLRLMEPRSLTDQESSDAFAPLLRQYPTDLPF
jgi:hypothetical protein